MKRKEAHTFSRVPRVECARSSFDRSHGLKTTFDEGYLVPIFVDEVVPGDSHKLNANLFARLATLQKPIMDNLYLETFWFFVPFRLLWDNHQRFWGEQDNPGDSTDYLVPMVEAPPGTSVTTGSIWDYFGVPVGVPNLKMSALYPRAYNKVWNNWFRDQNLQDSVPEIRGDTDDPANYVLLKRGKRHDYFTGALPFPQKGPEVLMPMAGRIPVVPANSEDPWFTNGVPLMDAVGTGVAIPMTYIPGGPPGTLGLMGTIPGVAAGPVWSDLQASADLSSAGLSATINDFRQAVVVQQFYETLARGGSRYVELLQSIYGVSNGDARLQRSEYLGGGRTSIMVNPVVNTAGGVGTPQGNLAAYGVGSSGGGHGFNKAFTEHGCILGLACVRADLNYQQGMPRMFSRRAKFDFLIPPFANLGEQAILNQEIFAQGSTVLNPSGTPVDEDVFGYVARYDDYRYKPSVITGLFRSNANPGPGVDQWHLAQDFATLPALSPEFIEEQPPIARIVAVPTEPHFLLDAWISLTSVRELPVYSVPGLRRI